MAREKVNKKEETKKKKTLVFVLIFLFFSVIIINILSVKFVIKTHDQLVNYNFFNVDVANRMVKADDDKYQIFNKNFDRVKNVWQEELDRKDLSDDDKKVYKDSLDEVNNISEYAKQMMFWNKNMDNEDYKLLFRNEMVFFCICSVLFVCLAYIALKK